MKATAFVLMSSCTFLATASAWAATDHIVMVGQNDAGDAALAFNPSSMNVEPGDTITFKNAGGQHNAHSSDASFSFACGSTGCATAPPDAGTWTAPPITVPVTAKGRTISYICDQHGAQMTGQIVVGTLPVQLQTFDVD